MRALSGRLAWRLFLVLVVLLGLFAYLGDRQANQYAASEGWVGHTKEVQLQLATLESDLADASEAVYQAQAAPDAVSRYQSLAMDVQSRMGTLKTLTADNPTQQTNLERARNAIQRRLSLIGARLSPPQNSRPESASEIADERAVADTVKGIVAEMNAEENRLLVERIDTARTDYLRLRIALGAGVIFALTMLALTFQTLLAQLSLRATAEQSVRKLSVHILRLQDTERRRLARELHDGIGQLFVALGMELDSLAGKVDGEPANALERTRKIATDGLTQTRTISYLLHPPLLDEVGFEHAAKWYVDGFQKRSKIEVSLTVSQPFKRLPEAIELVLFRAIQESLANVHRHSGSTRAQIAVDLRANRVTATIQDFGKGISDERLKQMKDSFSGVGVGLGGMRERVSELGGEFDVRSGSGGTTVRVSLPLQGEAKSSPDDTNVESSAKMQKQASNAREQAPPDDALLTSALQPA